MKTERIFVVDRKRVNLGEYGFFLDPDRKIYTDLLAHGHFVERAPAETNPALKQLVPYLIVMQSDTCFLMRRSKRQSEARLHDRYSLGIGGHINEADVTSAKQTDLILAGLDREMAEEIQLVNTGDDFTPTPQYQGLINNDRSEVGQVHLGLCFIMHLPPQMSMKIRETELMTGKFVSWRESASFYSKMEEWSQIVFDHFIADRF